MLLMVLLDAALLLVYQLPYRRNYSTRVAPLGLPSPAGSSSSFEALQVPDDHVCPSALMARRKVMVAHDVLGKALDSSDGP
jgi:hypothetical protein